MSSIHKDWKDSFKDEPTKATVENILAEADRLTAVVRQGEYGHPHDVYTEAGRMVSSFLELRYKKLMPLNSEDICMILLIVKIAREASKTKRDNIVDIAGYARLIEMIQDKKAETK